jgi:hypothetical protein
VEDVVCSRNDYSKEFVKLRKYYYKTPVLDTIQEREYFGHLRTL